MKAKAKRSDTANRRSNCAIANALDRFGDKWSLLIVRDMFAGKKTYGQFAESAERIPTNILAERLKRLEENGIIRRSPYQQRPVRYAYELTESGRKLGRVLRAVADWGLDQIADTRVMPALAAPSKYSKPR